MIKVKWQRTLNGPEGEAVPPPAPANSNASRRPQVTKREMEPISEETASPRHTTEWSNDMFSMNEAGEVCNRMTQMRITKDEVRTHGEEVLKGLIEYVHNRMLREFQFVEQAIPAIDFERSSVASSFNPSSSVRSSSSSICSTADGFRTMVDSDVPRCIFHTSQDFSIAEKLLVFVCSSRGLSCGIWSRSLLLHDGVQVGSMIPYFHEAIKAGYGILVMNPNMNTQTMINEDGVEEKLPIHGSSTQEEHVEHVWKNYIFPSAAHKIHFIAYGYGGVLVMNLIEKYKYELKSRLGNVAFVESSHKVDPKWAGGFRRFFSQHSICWKRSREPINTDLSLGDPGDDENGSTSPTQAAGYGCKCLSAGPLPDYSSSPAYTTKAVLKTVFRFLDSPNAYEYHHTATRKLILHNMIEEENALRATKHTPHLRSSHRQASTSCPEKLLQPRQYDSLTIEDFQLLKVVGRGAFGKVMLVKKKKKDANGNEVTVGNNKVYAMKVIKKAAVFAKNQVEHTKTERRILQCVDHPFMVKLRFAFQNSSKLYFVMDFYNGGTLHFHLRQARHFDEYRTRFYAAQLVLAISHLHTYNIVYRDLKPENILLDNEGFLALTDFGLSRDNFDAKDGMQTFCGTPEYIAPELIRRIPYGRAVDYWSMGVLIYEMLAGYTPFFHVNRKRNFENIVKMPLRFPSEFSDEAKSLLRGMICKDPSKRLGSGPTGANEIMDHPFFAGLDWERLYKKDVPVPFKPVVKKDGELSNIPEFFKRQEVMDSVGVDAPIGKADAFKDFSYVDPYQL